MKTGSAAMGTSTRFDAMIPEAIQQVPLDRVTQTIYARIFAAMAPLQKEMQNVQASAAILTGVFGKFWESLPILDAPAYVAMREQLAVVLQALHTALKVPLSMPTRILAAQLVLHDLPRLAAIAVKLNEEEAPKFFAAINYTDSNFETFAVDTTKKTTIRKADLETAIQNIVSKRVESFTALVKEDVTKWFAGQGIVGDTLTVEAAAEINTAGEAKPVQVNEERVDISPSVAVAKLKALEKEEMGKPKKKGVTFTYYGPGSGGKRNPLSPLQQARKDAEITMFQAGVYKEAQRRGELIEGELYDNVDEDRKAVLERALWLKEWLTCEVLQELHATPNHDEREGIMMLEETKKMRQEHWQEEDKARATKIAELARKEREKEELSKQEETENLRDITKRVQTIGQMQAELARQMKDVAPQVAAARSAKTATDAEPDMLTIREAARFCQCVEKTIRNRLRKVNPDGSPMLAGVIGKGRLTRIPRKSLEPFRKRVKATPNKHCKRPSRKAVKK